ncbi:LysR substrate-binding domain-containing protein [Sulfitobacter sp. LCG007]
MATRFTLRQLEYLVAVGEAGSIALAAEKVHVSSPSISTAISQLEAEFGLQLFLRRHAQGLALTQAGRQFMEQARNVLREAAALGSLAGEISGNVQGPMAVGCLSTFAELILPGLRREFENRYPDVVLRQSELHQQDLIEGLRGGNLDIALTYDLDVPDDLRFVPLASLPPYVLLPANHPLAGCDALCVSDLAELPMVLLDLPLSRDYFLSVFREAGVVPRIAERTRDMAVMRSLVGNGFGYSIANMRPLGDLSPDGRPLRCIPLSGEVRPMRMGLLMAAGSDTVLTVTAFIEHCREAAAAGRVAGLRSVPPRDSAPAAG